MLDYVNLLSYRYHLGLLPNVEDLKHRFDRFVAKYSRGCICTKS